MVRISGGAARHYYDRALSATNDIIRDAAQQHGSDRPVCAGAGHQKSEFRAFSHQCRRRISITQVLGDFHVRDSRRGALKVLAHLLLECRIDRRHLTGASNREVPKGNARVNGDQAQFRFEPLRNPDGPLQCYLRLRSGVISDTYRTQRARLGRIAARRHGDRARAARQQRSADTPWRHAPAAAPFGRADHHYARLLGGGKRMKSIARRPTADHSHLAWLAARPLGGKAFHGRIGDLLDELVVLGPGHLLGSPFEGMHKGQHHRALENRSQSVSERDRVESFGRSVDPDHDWAAAAICVCISDRWILWFGRRTPSRRNRSGMRTDLARTKVGCPAIAKRGGDVRTRG